MKSKSPKNIFSENLKSNQKKSQLSIDTQFQLATSFHQQGRLEEASVLYKTVLSSKPNHADALHLFGLVQAQSGKLIDAIELISKAISYIPNQPIFQNNLGNIYSELLQFDNAIECYDKAISLDTAYQEALRNKGSALFKQSKFKDAIQVFEVWLSVNPSNPIAYFNIGTAYLNYEDLESAKKYLEKAIILENTYLDAYINLGVIEYKLKNYPEALRYFDISTNLDKNAYEPYNYRGLIHLALNQVDQMRSEFQNLIKLNKVNPHAYVDFGFALMELAGNIQPILGSNDLKERQARIYEEALSALNIAKNIDSSIPVIYYNNACIYKNMGIFDLSIENYLRAIELKSDYYQALNNLAGLLDNLNLCEESIRYYQLASNLNNTERVIENYNLAFPQLKVGDFENGWRNYEDRWKARDNQEQRHFTQPVWLGKESLEGKTIFIHAEQGLGDTLQFIRYVPMVAALGAKVCVELPSELLNLFESMRSISILIKKGDLLPDFDFHCPMMSLPLAFNTSLDSIPPTVQIAIPIEKKQYWSTKLGLKEKLRVGLVWSGGFRLNQPEIWDVNERRNLPLHHLKVLAGIDVDFISLQKGEPAESDFRQAVATVWDGPVIRDHVDELKDFSDTAALVMNLDLVIAVDTSTAHLAASLGRPVWLLNRHDTCWRWLLEREDSPWYPSVKIYRQQSSGDWDSVIQSVRNDLIQLITQK